MTSSMVSKLLVGWGIPSQPAKSKARKVKCLVFWTMEAKTSIVDIGSIRNEEDRVVGKTVQCNWTKKQAFEATILEISESFELLEKKQLEVNEELCKQTMELAQNQASSKATGKRKLTPTDLDSDHTSQVRSRPKKKAAAPGQSKNQHNDNQEDRPATHEKKKKNDDLAKEKRERALILRQQKSSLIEKLNKKLNDTSTPPTMTSSPKSGSQDPHTSQRSPLCTSPSFPHTPQRLSSCSPQRSPPHTQQISFSCTSQRSPPHMNTSRRSSPRTPQRSSPRTPQRWTSFQRSPPPTAASPRSPSPPVQTNIYATSKSPISQTRKSLIFSHGQHPPTLASVNAKGHPTVAGKQPRKHFQHQQHHQQPQHHQQQTQQQQHQQQTQQQQHQQQTQQQQHQQQTHQQQQQECPSCNELRLKIAELTRELEDARADVIKNSEEKSQQYARLRPGFYTAEVATKNGMVELVEGTSIYIHKDQLASSQNCGTKGGESIARNLLSVFFTKQELERGSLTSSDSSKYTPLNSVIVEAIIAFAINNSASKRTTIAKAMRNSLTSKRCKARKQKTHII